MEIKEELPGEICDNKSDTHFGATVEEYFDDSARKKPMIRFSVNPGIIARV
jgi:hypothetical protein